MRTERINFLDFSFDGLSFEQTKSRLKAVTSTTPYMYLVTPNVDHVVRTDREPKLRDLYAAADLCLCDSQILRLLARLRGIKLALVPGSDLCRTLFSDVIQRGDRIAILGGSQADLEILQSQFPDVEFVHHEPPVGLCGNAEARRSAAAFIASANARFCLLAVGSPQQEMIAREAREHNNATGLALCIGAGLDFVTGKQRRAPRLLRRLGLEWAYRLLTNPRRLWRRYLIDGVRIFPIYARWRPRSRRTLWRAMVLVIAVMVLAAIYAGFFTNGRKEGPTATTSASVPAGLTGANNLAPPNVFRPIRPEQAVKENAERPFVNRPDTAAGRFVLKADASDRDRALNCLAQAVYYEAAGEGDDGGRAVAQVVLNRVRHPGYPSSICGVIYQGSDRPTGCQFTFTCDGSLLRATVQSLWTRSLKIAQEALAGRVFAPIGHATSYHADYVLPYWADALDKTVQIGRHIFYRLRGVYGDNRSFFQHYSGAEPQIRDPAAAMVLPQSSETSLLASALISDGVNGSQSEVEKAAPATSPLLADSTASALIADTQAAPVTSQKIRPSGDCSASGDRKKLAPLRAMDMRSNAAASSC